MTDNCSSVCGQVFRRGGPGVADAFSATHIVTERLAECLKCFEYPGLYLGRS